MDDPQDERVSAYQATSEMIPTAIERTIKKVCNNQIITDYMKSLKTRDKVLYECSNVKIYGTSYRKGQFVLLPGSTNSLPKFGKITKLLSSEECGYFMYRKTRNSYDHNFDVYIIEEQQEFEVIAAHHLACFHPLESYEIGFEKKISISLRSQILEHI